MSSIVTCPDSTWTKRLSLMVICRFNKQMPLQTLGMQRFLCNVINSVEISQCRDAAYVDDVDEAR